MNNYYAKIKEHAHAVPHQEVCGFLFFDHRGSLQAEWGANIADDPSLRFEISTEAHLEAIRTGDLAAYYHSHWNCDETFSPEDIRRSETAALPVFVYSTHTQRFNLHRPIRSMPPLVGRKFVLGFQDCAALVTDYVKLRQNFELPYFARPVDMLRNGFPELFRYLESHGYERVSLTGLKEHDILAFSVNTPNACHPNHVGVYLGDNSFVHQLAGMNSAITALTSEWTNQLLFAARLKR